MSIAAVSSSLVARLGALAPVAAAAPATVGGASSPQRNQGRRHELVSAVVDALGVEVGDRHAEQAVFKFAHALLHDLREVGGAPAASGRRDWSDIGPRLDALATAAAAAPAPSTVPTAEAQVEPSPLTATTAALHVMKVPSSRLIEAFQTLREAVPALSEVAHGDATGASGQLAAFLQRLAGVAPQGDDASLAGALLHTTA
jgi:hypothetical protein